MYTSPYRFNLGMGPDMYAQPGPGAPQLSWVPMQNAQGGGSQAVNSAANLLTNFLKRKPGMPKPADPGKAVRQVQGMGGPQIPGGMPSPQSVMGEELDKIGPPPIMLQWSHVQLNVETRP